MDEKTQKEFDKVHTSIVELGEAMVKGFEVIEKRFDRVEGRLMHVERELVEVKDGLLGVRSEVINLNQRFDTLEKNLLPLGDPMETTDLYGRVSYIEDQLGIKSGKA